MRIECCWFRVLGSRVTGSGLRLTVHCSCCTFRFPMVWALCGVAARDFFFADAKCGKGAGTLAQDTHASELLIAGARLVL